MIDENQTLMPDDDDDDDQSTGPLSSTLIDRWYRIQRNYSAIFRDDLTVRRNQFVQIIRSSHPHWFWVRNEENREGFVPSDCFTS